MEERVTASPDSRPSFRTIPEIIQVARQRLSPAAWDFVSGGAGTGVTVRRNRQDMERWALRPRVLAGISSPRLATTLLGRSLASPVLLAPVGSVDPVLAGRVAAERGTGVFVGILSAMDLSAIPRATRAESFFQLYARGDRGWIADVIRRVEDAGYAGLCITADSLGSARRGRDQRNEYHGSGAPKPNIPPGGGLAHQVRFSWSDLEWVRAQTSLPLIIKGIMTSEDARQAVRTGVDCVYVSNHGGRELDHGLSTISVLAGIAELVGDDAEVVVDSGFVHGTDVVKALALGARAVCVGRLQAWSLAANGAAGLADALALLDAEIAEVMQLVGCPDISALGRSQLVEAPVTRDDGPWPELADSIKP